MSMHPTRNYFQEFKGNCDCFVETGTYMGEGITLAIKAGFTLIHSIDIKDQIPEWYKHEATYYRHIGDSVEKLGELLPELSDKKTMFWLDAHHQLMEDEPLGVNPFPLKAEIEQIARHPIKEHVIIIDDLLYMTNEMLTGLSYQNLIYMIKEINWDYKFELVANPVIKNILIAHL